jgi:hypothetical protein
VNLVEEQEAFPALVIFFRRGNGSNLGYMVHASGEQSPVASHPGSDCWPEGPYLDREVYHDAQLQYGTDTISKVVLTSVS